MSTTAGSFKPSLGGVSVQGSPSKPFKYSPYEFSSSPMMSQKALSSHSAQNSTAAPITSPLGEAEPQLTMVMFCGFSDGIHSINVPLYVLQSVFFFIVIEIRSNRLIAGLHSVFFQHIFWTTNWMGHRFVYILSIS